MAGNTWSQDMLNLWFVFLPCICHLKLALIVFSTFLTPSDIYFEKVWHVLSKILKVIDRLTKAPRICHFLNNLNPERDNLVVKIILALCCLVQKNRNQWMVGWWHVFSNLGQISTQKEGRSPRLQFQLRMKRTK